LQSLRSLHPRPFFSADHCAKPRNASEAKTIFVKYHLPRVALKLGITDYPYSVNRSNSLSQAGGEIEIPGWDRRRSRMAITARTAIKQNSHGTVLRSKTIFGLSMA